MALVGQPEYWDIIRRTSHPLGLEKKLHVARYIKPRLEFAVCDVTGERPNVYNRNCIKINCIDVG